MRYEISLSLFHCCAGCQWPSLSLGTFGVMKSLAIITIFLNGGCAFGAGDRLPCDDVSKSPDAKWKIIYESPATNQPYTGTELFLVNADGTMLRLRHIDRSCDVLWSSDSSRIAVTDWLGCDVSDIFLYTVTNLESVVSVGSLFPKSSLPQVESSGHCYYEAMKWLDDQRLQIRVFGHADDGPSYDFDHPYIFELSSHQFEKVIPKMPNKTVQPTADGAVSSASRSAPRVGGG